eukprot:gene9009-1108_t
MERNKDENYYGDFTAKSLFTIPTKKHSRSRSQIITRPSSNMQRKRSSTEMRLQNGSLTEEQESPKSEQEEEISPRSDGGYFSSGSLKEIHQKFLQRVGTINLEEQQLDVKLPNSIKINSKNNPELKIAICTFNVAEAYSDTIGPWIASHKADIYAIGLQEIDMSPKAFVKKSQAIENWDEHFKKSFEFQNFKDYKKVVSEQFVGMYHCIFIHKDHYKFLSNGYWSKIGLGVLGFGNKGCIAYRFNLYHHSFCFINSHFVSSKSKVNERNQNHDDILTDDVFSNLNYRPLLHDFLFFYGDLNYRVNLSRDDVFKNMKEGNIKNLLKKDQLNIEKEKKKIFNGFQEGEITFLPTFKFNKNSGKYDSSKKQRVPSYCDRILVKSKEKGSVEIESYESKKDEFTSDHRPVLSLMKVELNFYFKSK